MFFTPTALAGMSEKMLQFGDCLESAQACICVRFLGHTGIAAVPAEARPEARSTARAVNCILILIWG